MTVTISASFPRSGDAKEAMTILRSMGYRVALTHQEPVQSPFPASCPGNGRPNLTNTVMLPSDRSAVLTVLVTGETRRFALETIRRCRGKTIHEPPHSRID